MTNLLMRAILSIREDAWCLLGTALSGFRLIFPGRERRRMQITSCPPSSFRSPLKLAKARTRQELVFFSDQIKVLHFDGSPPGQNGQGFGPIKKWQSLCRVVLAR